MVLLVGLAERKEKGQIIFHVDLLVGCYTPEFFSSPKFFFFKERDLARVPFGGRITSYDVEDAFI